MRKNNFKNKRIAVGYEHRDDDGIEVEIIPVGSAKIKVWQDSISPMDHYTKAYGEIEYE